MSDYGVDFRPQAADESRGIPALGEVARDPWNASYQQDPNDLYGRVALVSEAGLASVYVDVEAQIVRVHTITWAG